MSFSLQALLLKVVNVRSVNNVNEINNYVTPFLRRHFNKVLTSSFVGKAGTSSSSSIESQR